MALGVAIVCQSEDRLEPWMQRLAEGIARAPDLSLAGFLTTGDEGAPRPAGTFFPIWWKFESRLAAKAQPADCPILSDMRESLPVLAANAKNAKALGADVIINLTAGAPAPELAAVAPLGVWSLDFLLQPEGAASLRFITTGAPVTELSLLASRGEHTPLRRVATAALNTKFAVSRNHLFMCEKAVTLILRELKRASMGGLDLDKCAKPSEKAAAPGPLAMVQYGFAFAGGMASRVIEKLATKAGLRPGMFFLKTADSDIIAANPSAMKTHATPANEYYADPFLWERDGETWCFFEVYDYRTGRGHLSAGKLTPDGLSDVTEVLKTEYHLSFPFLFEHDGELYMMPETCGAHRIETWRCIEFPNRWERAATILDDVIAADSSLARIGDEWWLFTNISTDPFGEMNSELHLYKVDGPGMTELTPHALNPVVFDSRTARNGGRILEKGGAYYRISQDNSHGRYGYGVNVMKIDHISLKDYRETMVRKIEPDFEAGAIGCHHMDARGGLVVMDVRKRVGGFGGRRP